MQFTFGTATKLNKKRNTSKIWVSVKPAVVDGTHYLQTRFMFPGDLETCDFLAKEQDVLEALPTYFHDIDQVVTGDLDFDRKLRNLAFTGDRLAKLLLQTRVPSNARAEREKLNAQLGHCDAAIYFDFNIPIPMEIIHFPNSSGGLGKFENFLGGRAQCAHPGYAERFAGNRTGTGVSFFHDSVAPSVKSGKVRTILERTFAGLVDEHRELLSSDLSQAHDELTRLFYGQTTWAHFQCHSEGPQAANSLRLTRNFPITHDNFRETRADLTGILLNSCYATKQSGTATYGLGRSWVDHFTGTCQVPVVVGPLSQLIDEQTTEFTDAFYASLTHQPSVYEAFVEARQKGLNDSAIAALLYRYVGRDEILINLSISNNNEVVDLFKSA